jgi:UPF0755 protein
MKRGLLILLAAAALVALLRAPRYFGQAPKNARAASVIVPQGAGLHAVARRLAQLELIGNRREFLAVAKLAGAGERIKAGEYAIPEGIGYVPLLRLLDSGQVVQHLVTVPEGMPSVLVAEKLNAEPLLTGRVGVPQEGSVLPDSYSFERGEPRAAVLKRMQEAMKKQLASAWKARKPSAAVKSPDEAIVLASIVEKETGKPSERRMVAGVYGNRLRIGMALQADPTVIYPITRGKPLGRRILQSELRANTGYNTYARAGLPQGPIANPGRASIDAVLDPAPTKALYFVADGSGGHVFADTLAAHNANVAKWYAIRRARGEM